MNTNLDRGPSRAIYEQIADHYRELIQRGNLTPGQRLPTLHTLTNEWGVSQRTIQKAVDVLRGEKLVETSRAHGTSVAPIRAVPGGRDLVHEPTGAPENDEVVVLSAEVVDCPAYVADLLAIEPDGTGARRVSRRESVTYRDSLPIRLAVAWHAPWAFEATPELGQARLVNGVRAIKEHTGHTPKRGKDFFEGRGADEREARHLTLEVGTPILAGTSVLWDAQGPVEYREWVSPQGHVVSHEYPVDIS